MTDDPLMTLPQIAAYAGDRSTDWVRRHTRLSDDNPLALHTVNIGGRICARRSEVNAWLDRLAA